MNNTERQLEQDKNGAPKIVKSALDSPTKMDTILIGEIFACADVLPLPAGAGDVVLKQRNPNKYLGSHRSTGHAV